MNIFWLDFIEFNAAQYHCDKHIVKMIVETVQLLYGALFLLYGSTKEGMLTEKLKLCFDHILQHMDQNEIVEAWKTETYKPYRVSHVGHPCLLWVMESYQNFQKLYQLGFELEKEYCRRYSKTSKQQHHHKCYIHLLLMKQIFEHDHLCTTDIFPANQQLTLPPLCMPDYCRQGYGQYDILDDDHHIKEGEISSMFRAYSWEHAVMAYRSYYIECKFEFAKYAHRNTPVPDWFTTIQKNDSPIFKNELELKKKRNGQWTLFSAKRDRKKTLLFKKAKTISMKIHENPEMKQKWNEIVTQIKTITNEPFIF